MRWPRVHFGSYIQVIMTVVDHQTLLFKLPQFAFRFKSRIMTLSHYEPAFLLIIHGICNVILSLNLCSILHSTPPVRCFPYYMYPLIHHPLASSQNLNIINPYAKANEIYVVTPNPTKLLQRHIQTFDPLAIALFTYLIELLKCRIPRRKATIGTTTTIIEKNSNIDGRFDCENITTEWLVVKTANQPVLIV